jgi:hypothetical protein
MWIDGVNFTWVLPAYVASFAGFLIYGIVGSRQQHKFQPIIRDAQPGITIDWGRIFIVALILVGTISTNVLFDFPALGVWIAILLGGLMRRPPWHELKHAWQGTIFLVSLVTIASMMPVEELPPASWQSAFILGFVSAIFDNIPLTKLCLDQGGYDWAILAYAVGFGGSMIWFGSSAGVALSNMYPQVRNSGKYVKSGWHVIVAYVISFFVMLAVLGWNPHEPHKDEHKSDTPAMQITPDDNALHAK